MLKNKVTSYIFKLCLPLILTQMCCSRMIEIDSETVDSKLVIESYLVTGDSLLVRVDYSFVSDEINPPTSGIKTASVKIYFENQEFNLIGYNKNMGVPENFTHPYYYYLPKSQFKIPESGIFKLKVSYNKQEVSSVFELPRKQLLKDFRFTENSNNNSTKNYDIEITSDFPDETGYYLVQGFIDSKSEYQNQSFFYHSMIINEMIIIKGDGQSKTISLKNKSSGEIVYEPFLYSAKLFRITKFHYDFYNSLLTQIKDNKGNLLDDEVTEIPTNIEGGFGIFTGMSVDSMSKAIQ